VGRYGKQNRNMPGAGLQGCGDSYSKRIQRPNSIVMLAQLRRCGEEDAADRHIGIAREIDPVAAHVWIRVRVVWKKRSV